MQARFVPKNATLIAIINSETLKTKLENSKGRIENILKLSADGDTSANTHKQEWEDLKQSGIDTNDNIYVTVVREKDEGAGGVTISSITRLKDASKLEAYLKKKKPESEVQKEKEYSYVSMGRGHVIAWNTDVVMIMMHKHEPNINDMVLDSAGNPMPQANREIDIKAEVAAYFSMKEDASMASVPEFRDMMSNKADVSVWMNTSALSDKIPFPLPKIKELLANAYTTATLNFEDGKIAVDSKSYFGKEFTEMLKKYSSAEADLDLVRNYPSDKINAFIVFGFDPQLIDAVVKFLEVGGMVDDFLTRAMDMPYTLQDALKAIKGKMALVVSDFTWNKKSLVELFEPLKLRPFPGQMLANIPVGDKTQSNKIMDKLAQQGLMMKTGNQYQLANATRTGGMQVIADDKNVFVTTDLNLLSQYKAQSKKATFKNDALDGLSGRAAAFYVDLESILGSIHSAGPGGDKVFAKARETFKDIKGYVKKFDGKALEGHYELRFRDERENSLTSLMSFVETASATANESRSQNEMNEGADEGVKVDSSKMMQP